MKKLFTLISILAVSLSMLAVPVYLVPNSHWKEANARFAVYAFGADNNSPTETWYDMTAVEGEEGVYYADINAAYKTIIFGRMNPEKTENNFNDDTRWNQTANLNKADGNRYVMTEDSGDNWGNTGTWTRNPYYIAGSESLTGEDREWWSDGIKLVNGKATLTLAAGSYEFKITDGSWNYENNTLSDQCTEGVTVNETSKNVTFTTYKESTEVTISFDGEKITVSYAPTYIVVGTKSLTGRESENGGWTNTYDSSVALDDNGEITFNDVKPGEHSFRIVIPGDWGTNHCYDQFDSANSTATDVTSEGGDKNIQFKTNKTQNITIKLDIANNKITLKAETSTVIYYVAGTENLYGQNWSVNGLALDDGKVTFKNLAAGEYEFKITDGSWNNNENETNHEFTTLGNDCSSSGVGDGNGSNIKFTLTEAQDVTITFDEETKEICVTIGSNGQTTAVEDANNAQNIDLTKPMYNVLGQQVGQDYRGIVLQEGKKYLLW